jgi:hypothetical protein
MKILRRLFSLDPATSIGLQSMLLGLVGGAMRIFKIELLKDVIFGTFDDGVFNNARLTVVNGQITQISETPSADDGSMQMLPYQFDAPETREIDASDSLLVSTIEDEIFDPISDFFVISSPPPSLDPMMTVKTFFDSSGDLVTICVNHSDSQKEFPNETTNLLVFQND